MWWRVCCEIFFFLMVRRPPRSTRNATLFPYTTRCRSDRVRRVILTAGGGPFRDARLDEMRRVTPEQAVAHPNWSMGAKISVDSATMMNKGLELIEAARLFPVRDRKSVV